MASFNALLPALVGVLETSQQHDGLASKQTLLNSTNGFKDILTKAKQLATSLPGGDMSLSDQDEVIYMLEKLRDHKRAQLALFSQQIVTSAENISVPEDH
ncbi:hypothetical protein K439DRAFT_1626531 [Ramaria rubella]|nr:hypothetical protein K439DRAFT_1626531 [Ramaria rubella]